MVMFSNFASKEKTALVFTKNLVFVARSWCMMNGRWIRRRAGAGSGSSMHPPSAKNNIVPLLGVSSFCSLDDDM